MNAGLKTRVALLTMTGLLGVILLLAWLQVRHLRAGFLDLLFAQQQARVRYIANQLNEALDSRQFILQKVAAGITAAHLKDPRRMEALLASKPELLRLFTLGMYAIGPEGRGVADFPRMEGRATADYRQRDYYLEGVRTRRPAIGRPVIGRFAKEPVLLLSVPILGSGGELLGVLVGANLIRGSELFNEVQVQRTDRSGDVFILSVRDRLFVSSTDASRVLEPLVPRGVNGLLDRFMDGYEGSGIMVNSRHVELVSSAYRVGNHGWIAEGVLPTATAFAPLRLQEKRVWAGALLASATMALLVWLALWRGLRPLEQAADAIHRMSQGPEPPHPIQVRGAREITAIVDRFNELQVELASRQAQLEDINRNLEARIEQAVTDLRVRDRMLSLQGRQAAMGEMIATIAHQWRQPLSSLSLTLQNIQDARRFGDATEAEIQAQFATAQGLIQGMSQTITDFRTFFQPDKEPVVFPLSHPVRMAAGLVEAHFLAAFITLDLVFLEDVRVEGHPNELAQVLLNLLVNARQAMEGRDPKGGRVRVAVSRAGGWGQITVADDGGGIPEDHLDRIFEPFYTTRARGAGLGLHMARQVVEGMGGSLTVRNEEGGAAFTLRIPGA